jgi:hypothetical protein
MHPEILDIFLFRKVYAVYVDWRAGFSSCGECDMDRIGPLAFVLNFLNHFCIASRLVCSSCEAIAGSLSVANTAVSSANVAIIDSVEVCRSAGLQCIARVPVAPEHCLEEHRHKVGRVPCTLFRLSRENSAMQI